MKQAVTDNTDKSRFELAEDGHTAYADYDRGPDGVLSIKYVFAPEALRGKGTAGRLMEGVAEAARAEGVKLYPICGYASSWLRRHEQHHDLLA